MPWYELGTSSLTRLLPRSIRRRMAALRAELRYLRAHWPTARIARGAAIRQSMMPESPDVCLDCAGEFCVLVQSSAVEALLSRLL